MILIMTVQEIFNTKAVQEIEIEILNLQYETEKRRLFRDSEGFAIKSLLGIRRNILHDYFVMDENYKLLLSLIKTRKDENFNISLWPMMNQMKMKQKMTFRKELSSNFPCYK